jgi:hypothetical protein
LTSLVKLAWSSRSCGRRLTFDYQLTVLRNACVDSDPQAHRVLIDKVFPRQPVVVDKDEWVKQIATAGVG